jgi:hypothetical protein
MTMTIEYKKISQIIDDLDTVQEKHIDSFDCELLPDIETQCIERNLAIGDLVKKIAAFSNSISEHQTEDGQEGVISLIKRISTLLKQNKTLENKVRIHKDGIEQSLKRLSTGKKIIKLYGSPPSVLNRPRVINYSE